MVGARIIAGFAAVAVFVPFFLGPLAIYRLLGRLPLSGPGADWEIWLLVLGGAIGASVARLGHWLVLTRAFQFSDRDADRAWDKQPKR
jgi:hypothetical protein